MRRMLVIVLCALSVLLAATWWLLLSESGGRWLVSRMTDNVPGLSVGATTGSLMEGITLQRLAYRDLDGLQLDVEDIRRMQAVWGERFIEVLAAMAEAPKYFSLQLLSGSLAHYRKATSRWWSVVAETTASAGLDLSRRPVYFVSSNTHSLPNLLTGFAPRHEEELLAYLRESQQEGLLKEYEAIDSRQDARNHNNLLYYVREYFTEV